MSRAVVKVSPSEIRRRISVDFSCEAVNHDAWRNEERYDLASTEKYRSIRLRYVDGRPWEETPLFTNIYPTRFQHESSIRGCASLEELLAQYYDRVDGMFADMRAKGYRRVIAGRDTPPIPVYIDHAGEMLLGNQGNHRLPMAQILDLPHVIVKIIGRAPGAQRQVGEPLAPLDPDLPESARSIPAMTSVEERRCYYRLARAAAGRGQVVELGAWLGAATAYLAAAMRDAKASGKVQVVDRFVWKPSSHDAKAGGPIQTTQLEAFRTYLGPLLEYVDVYPTELKSFTWRGGRIGLLVCDAPKRIPEISLVLSAVADAMSGGAMMAWQDFAYFPSYDIPAALIRLERHLDFVEAVAGTTAVFRVRSPWLKAAVTPEALALKSWTPAEVVAAWSAWGARLPEEMRARFACGAALFLCDLGATDLARRHLTTIVNAHRDQVLPKWQYLIRERAKLMQRYEPLVRVIQQCA